MPYTRSYDYRVGNFYIGAPDWLTTDVSTGTVTYSESTGTAGVDPGVAYLQTGGSSSGRAALKTMKVFGNSDSAAGAHWGRMMIGAWDAASSSGERYTIRIGFMSDFTAEPAHGMYFRYSDNLNSSRWQCVTRSSGSETATDSGTTMNYSSGRLEIFKNESCNSIVFVINGNVVATNTTNVTTAAMGFGCSVIKSVGTTARGIYIDELTYAY